MSAYIINVHIKPEYSAYVAAEPLAHVVQAALENQKQPEDSEVTLVITDDSKVQELNKKFRGIDSATDVLSFPARESQGFITPEGLPNYLGDVIVSYPTAAAQAEEQDHPVEDELALLIVHGCLHLLGYDHQTDEEQQRMWAIQEQILLSLR
jgi:probable rRNA maturation factor